MSDFQRRATEQGREFERAVECLAKIERFEVKERRWRHPTANVEIDFVLWREDTGEVWVDCKGSYEGNRPGLERTDTCLKAIAVAAILAELPGQERRPLWLVASHLPRPDTVGATWLTLVGGRLFDRIITVGLLPPTDLEDDMP